MKSVPSLFALAFFIATLSSSLQSIPAKSLDFTIFGYLPEWRYDTVNFDDVAKHLTHIIVFSVEPFVDGEIIGRDRLPQGAYLEQLHAGAKKYGTKILVSFGGNARSFHFAKMCENVKTRAYFIKNLN